VKQKLDCFCNLKVEPKDCENPLHWWEPQESQYSMIGIFVQQNFNIVGSQIEMKRVLTIAGLITSLRQCDLDSKNLDQLILVAKNWPNDSQVSHVVEPQG